MRSMLLYASSNGDRWLITDEDGKDPFIRHEPNVASGGKAEHFSIREFLTQQQGPQHEALLTRIGAYLSALLDEDQPGG